MIGHDSMVLNPSERLIVLKVLTLYIFIPSLLSESLCKFKNLFGCFQGNGRQSDFTCVQHHIHSLDKQVLHRFWQLKWKTNKQTFFFFFLEISILLHLIIYIYVFFYYVFFASFILRGINNFGTKNTYFILFFLKVMLMRELGSGVEECISGESVWRLCEANC